MSTDNIIRRLRGAVGNAVVWGACWAATACAVMAGMVITGLAPEGAMLIDAPLVGARFGVMGAITGGAFSLAIGLLYRGRRLSEISWMRFGVGGGLAAGLFVPAFMTVARLLSGDSFLPLENLLTNGSLSALFGGVAAGASMWLAQRAERLSGGGPGRLSGGGGADALTAGDVGSAWTTPRSRVAQR
ncbi:hypothetical protein [Longimicrobium sp.]|uniref:hypothetical protein n=1 Tax=Longimicrobium sp. TaxID=2029185 RepID=UPI002E37199E|nr:hypothetical protein [Longimicrobium sp.]HEX6040279.1 hypothetical protein [Longimicrobium sp.]